MGVPTTSRNGLVSAGRLLPLPAGRLALLVLLAAWAGGCGSAGVREEDYVKDGRRYGTTDAYVWRPTWWNFYQRGLSFAEGGFRKEAEEDFRAAVGESSGALAPRPDDARRARTYGVHVLEDYFPRRELGVIAFQRGDYTRATEELERSLASAPSARAKYYLSLVRKETLRSEGASSDPPAFRVSSPSPGQAFNQPSVEVAGSVSSRTYVSALSIGGRGVFIELAEKEIPFREELALPPGRHSLRLRAEDLLGGAGEREIEVFVDLAPPLIAIESCEPGPEGDRISGEAADDWKIARLQIGGAEVPLPSGGGRSAPFAVTLPPGRALSIRAEDWAGNATVLEGSPGDVCRAAPRSPSLLARVAERVIGGAAACAADRSAGSSPSLRIELEGGEAVRAAWCDHYFLSGRVRGPRGVTSLEINGESVLGKPALLAVFNRRIELREGENRVLIRARDESGETVEKEITLVRRTPEIWLTSSRFSLALLPLQPERASPRRAEEAYSLLLNAFLAPPERFSFVERDKSRLESLLIEQKLSASGLTDREAAATIGRLIAADGLLYGSVSEDEEGVGVSLWLVDPETTEIIHFADVYGGDKSIPGLAYLMEGLALKFKQYFPLVSGDVLRADPGGIATDLGAGRGIKLGMKYLCYRSVPAGEGEVKIPLRADGRPVVSRVVSVEEGSSFAEIPDAESAALVRTGDKVITK